MSIFQRMFDVFSKRPEAGSKPSHDVPQTARNRVVLWCDEVFSNSRSSRLDGPIGRGGDYRQEFWQEIHRFLRYRQGRSQLCQGATSIPADTIGFLMACPGKEFLDFLEDLFRVECLFHINLTEPEMVDDLNDLLRLDDLPYHITHFVKENVQGPTPGSYTIHIRAYPKVIMRESELLHANAIAPVLTLLQRPHFANVNSEYLAALEDYRKGDYRDCLTKCGSAFESVLKVICARKGWPHDPVRDTSSTLIKTVLTNTGLESYFESMLMIVTTLRNRLSSSHGAGTAPKQAPAHLAQYALNATASAILLLTQETGEA
jgi:hypothetical protein